jgi:hypothetical protein
MANLALVAAVLGDLPREGLRFVAVLVAVVSCSLLVSGRDRALISGFLAGRSDSPPLPPEHLAVMVEVSAGSGVPAALLASIASVESGFGANMATSSAGAIGYGQFLPSSWEAYGQGGDPYDYRDAIPAMARYLADHGAPADIANAVYAYNHSWEYVALVLGRARTSVGRAPNATPALRAARR